MHIQTLIDLAAQNAVKLKAALTRELPHGSLTDVEALLPAASALLAAEMIAHAIHSTDHTT